MAKDTLFGASTSGAAGPRIWIQGLSGCSTHVYNGVDASKYVTNMHEYYIIIII